MTTNNGVFPRSPDLTVRRCLQDIELATAIEKFGITNIIDRSEYADYDSYTKLNPRWRNISLGAVPSELIVYSNTSLVVDIVELVNTLDQWAVDLLPNGRIYCALNKWTLWCSQPEPDLLHLDYDQAIAVYFSRHLKNFTVEDYKYIPNDTGNIGNWVHGNNRIWLVKQYA